MTEVELFEKYVIRKEGCWEWSKFHHNTGYAQVTHQKKTKMVHRMSYEIEYGEIPGGMELDHLCKNRGCVNPSHLEPVTHLENIRRGDSPSQVLSRNNICKQGHSLTGDNVRWYQYGKRVPHRVCRRCAKQAQLRFKAKRAAGLSEDV